MKCNIHHLEIDYRHSGGERVNNSNLQILAYEACYQPVPSRLGG